MVVGGRELIDTLWNVNYFSPLQSAIVVIELIDTLWNVNALVIEDEPNEYFELIDTLWNVNCRRAEWLFTGHEN